MTAAAKKAKVNGGSGAKKATGKKVAADKPELVDEVAGKGRTLPGMEVVVVKSIVNAVRQIEDVSKPAFGIARDKLIRDQETLKDACHRNLQHFKRTENPDGSVTLAYKGGGVEVEITQNEEKIKAKLIKDETEISTRKTDK